MAKYTEVDLLEDAVAGTEREILSDALSNEPLDGGDDQSLEAMEEPGGPDEIIDEGDGGDEGDEAQGADGEEVRARDPETGRFAPKPAEVAQQPARAERVPLSELMTERRGRQDAETRVTALTAENSQVMQTLNALNARLDAMALQMGRPAAERKDATPAEPEIDIFTDPNKVLTDLRSGILSDVQQTIVNQRVETTFEAAHDAHGAAFEEAYKDLTAQDHRDPGARAQVQRIMRSGNPGKALMKWHGEQKIVREVGGDPAKYRERVAAELLQDPAFRKQLVDSLRADAQNPGGVRHVVRAPNNGGQRPARKQVPSLSEASGGSAQLADPDLYDTSDRSAFDFAFSN